MVFPIQTKCIAPGEHSVGHLPVEDDGGLLRRGETDVERHPAVNDGNPAQRRGDCPLDPPEIRNNAEALQRIVVYERTTRTREGEVVLIERFEIPPSFRPLPAAGGTCTTHVMRLLRLIAVVSVILD